jgi:ferric-dicitrate binding protein FerR (iron transport regulator)
MNQEQILNYITGNCSSFEAEQARQWIDADPANKSEFIRIKNLYALSASEIHSENVSREYRKVSRKLGFEQHRIKMLTIQAAKYAAIVVIAFATAWFMFSYQPQKNKTNTELAYHEIVVPKGQTSEFVFEDGTRVWLNSGSLLRMPASHNPVLREVFLEGEAYFEVEKNPDRPFIVHTSALDVKVLGTSFNIQAYSDLPNLETTLVEGSVEILNKSQVKLAELKKGELLRFSKTQKTGNIEKVDTAPYYAWRDGKLVFKDKPLVEIAAQLERWYNVDITFADNSIRDFRFSGTILRNKPFDQVLQAIKLTAPIRYTIKVNPESSNEIVLYATKK